MATLRWLRNMEPRFHWRLPPWPLGICSVCSSDRPPKRVQAFLSRLSVLDELRGLVGRPFPWPGFEVWESVVDSAAPFCACPIPGIVSGGKSEKRTWKSLKRVEAVGGVTTGLEPSQIFVSRGNDGIVVKQGDLRKHYARNTRRLQGYSVLPRYLPT